MTMLPRSRLGRVGLWVLRFVELSAPIALLIILGRTVGRGFVIFMAAMTVLALAFGWWLGRRAWRLRRSDPAGAQRAFDRDMTAFGKFFAVISALMMGIGIVAVIVIFATHG